MAPPSRLGRARLGLLAGETPGWLTADGPAPDAAAPGGIALDGIAPDAATPEEAVPNGMAPDGGVPDGIVLADGPLPA